MVLYNVAATEIILWRLTMEELKNTHEDAHSKADVINIGLPMPPIENRPNTVANLYKQIESWLIRYKSDGIELVPHPFFAPSTLPIDSSNEKSLAKPAPSVKGRRIEFILGGRNIFGSADRVDISIFGTVKTLLLRPTAESEAGGYGWGILVAFHNEPGPANTIPLTEHAFAKLLGKDLAILNG
jgi:hypothetical protein